MNMKEETQTGLGGAAELTSVTFSVYLEGDLVLFSSPDLQTRVVSSQLPEPLPVHGKESSCHHRRPEEEEEPDKNENELHQRSPRGQRSEVTEPGSLEGSTGVLLLQLCRDRNPLVVHLPVEGSSHGVAGLSLVTKVVVVDDVDHRTHDGLPVLRYTVWGTDGRT